MHAISKPVLDWNAIQTVFLDMDGTLLDLQFDNHFWLQHLPLRFGERHGMSFEQARDHLLPRFRSMEGRLQWYCLDHWSRELGLDVLALKRELRHMIRVLPHAEIFLQCMRAAGRRLVLVTNAHNDALALKMECTRLATHFDAIVSSHSYGTPKESDGFWQQLHASEKFDSTRALLVDDSLPVLRAAQKFGIQNLVAIRQPDSKRPERDITEFASVRVLEDLIP